MSAPVRGRLDETGTGVVVDFTLKFIEACGFLAIANLLDKPVAAAWGLVFLLVFNTVWGIAVSWLISLKPRAREEVRWASINVVTMLGLSVFLLVHGGPLSEAKVDRQLASVLFLVPIVRTVLDYNVCWTLYWPALTGD